MKKIGIMTMQRIINYGSFLQAYGLKQIIEQNFNFTVQFIDFQTDRVLIEEKKEKNILLNKIIQNRDFLTYIKKKIFLEKLSQKYKKDLEAIGIQNTKNYSHDIDILIIGSDEVFNCMQGLPVGYSKNLFGYSYENCKVISYAGSFGHTTVKDLHSYGVYDEIKEMLNRFSGVSVRDANSLHVLESMGIINVQKNLDPVLIYDYRNDLRKRSKAISNYIIIYAYTGRLNRKEEHYIKEFARRRKKKIVSIGYFSSIADLNIICNPLEVFDYFSNADYIITDTFHGTIFSIKTHSKFCTIIRNSNNNKLVDLLSTLKRTDRIATNLEEIDLLYEREIDYAPTDEIIEEERNKTMDYLREKIIIE